MATGRRKAEVQQTSFIPAAKLAQSAAHPFYSKLNEILAAHQFDPFVKGLCATFYGEKIGRPSLAPGKYFRPAADRLPGGNRLGARHYLVLPGFRVAAGGRGIHPG